ncbi:MAG: hypothetical protein WDW36_003323 [Sanguina aurantia]
MSGQQATTFPLPTAPPPRPSAPPSLLRARNKMQLAEDHTDSEGYDTEHDIAALPTAVVHGPTGRQHRQSHPSSITPGDAHTPGASAFIETRLHVSSNAQLMSVTFASATKRAARTLSAHDDSSSEDETITAAAATAAALAAQLQQASLRPRPSRYRSSGGVGRSNSGGGQDSIRPSTPQSYARRTTHNSADGGNASAGSAAGGDSLQLRQQPSDNGTAHPRQAQLSAMLAGRSIVSSAAGQHEGSGAGARRGSGGGGAASRAHTPGPARQPRPDEVHSALCAAKWALREGSSSDSGSEGGGRVVRDPGQKRPKLGAESPDDGGSGLEGGDQTSVHSVPSAVARVTAGFPTPGLPAGHSSASAAYELRAPARTNQPLSTPLNRRNNSTPYRVGHTAAITVHSSGSSGGSTSSAESTAWASTRTTLTPAITPSPILYNPPAFGCNPAAHPLPPPQQDSEHGSDGGAAAAAAATSAPAQLPQAQQPQAAANTLPPHLQQAVDAASAAVLEVATQLVVVSVSRPPPPFHHPALFRTSQPGDGPTPAERRSPAPTWQQQPQQPQQQFSLYREPAPRPSLAAPAGPAQTTLAGAPTGSARAVGVQQASEEGGSVLQGGLEGAAGTPQEGDEGRCAVIGGSSGRLRGLTGGGGRPGGWAGGSGGRGERCDHSGDDDGTSAAQSPAVAALYAAAERVRTTSLPGRHASWDDPGVSARASDATPSVAHPARTVTSGQAAHQRPPPGTPQHHRAPLFPPYPAHSLCTTPGQPPSQHPEPRSPQLPAGRQGSLASGSTAVTDYSLAQPARQPGVCEVSAAALPPPLFATAAPAVTVHGTPAAHFPGSGTSSGGSSSGGDGPHVTRQNPDIPLADGGRFAPRSASVDVGGLGQPGQRSHRTVTGAATSHQGESPPRQGWSDPRSGDASECSGSSGGDTTGRVHHPTPTRSRNGRGDGPDAPRSSSSSPADTRARFRADPHTPGTQQLLHADQQPLPQPPRMVSPPMGMTSPTVQQPAPGQVLSVQPAGVAAFLPSSAAPDVSRTATPQPTVRQPSACAADGDSSSSSSTSSDGHLPQPAAHVWHAGSSATSALASHPALARNSPTQQQQQQRPEEQQQQQQQGAGLGSKLMDSVRPGSGEEQSLDEATPPHASAGGTELLQMMMLAQDPPGRHPSPARLHPTMAAPLLAYRNGPVLPSTPSLAAPSQSTPPTHPHDVSAWLASLDPTAYDHPTHPDSPTSRGRSASDSHAAPPPCSGQAAAAAAAGVSPSPAVQAGTQTSSSSSSCSSMPCSPPRVPRQRLSQQQPSHSPAAAQHPGQHEQQPAWAGTAQQPASHPRPDPPPEPGVLTASRQGPQHPCATGATGAPAETAAPPPPAAFAHQETAHAPMLQLPSPPHSAAPSPAAAAAASPAAAAAAAAAVAGTLSAPALRLPLHQQASAAAAAVPHQPSADTSAPTAPPSTHPPTTAAAPSPRSSAASSYSGTAQALLTQQAHEQASQVTRSLGGHNDMDGVPFAVAISFIMDSLSAFDGVARREAAAATADAEAAELHAASAAVARPGTATAAATAATAAAAVDVSVSSTMPAAPTTSATPASVGEGQSGALEDFAVCVSAPSTAPSPQPANSTSGSLATAPRTIPALPLSDPSRGSASQTRQRGMRCASPTPAPPPAAAEAVGVRRLRVLGSEAGAQRQGRGASQPALTAGGARAPRGGAAAAVPAAAAGRGRAAAVSSTPATADPWREPHPSPSPLSGTDLPPAVSGGGMSPLRNIVARSPPVGAEEGGAAGVAVISGPSPPELQPQVGATTLPAAAPPAPATRVRPPTSEAAAGSRSGAGTAANSPTRGASSARGQTPALSAAPYSTPAGSSGSYSTPVSNRSGSGILSRRYSAARARAPMRVSLPEPTVGMYLQQLNALPRNVTPGGSTPDRIACSKRTRSPFNIDRRSPRPAQADTPSAPGETPSRGSPDLTPPPSSPTTSLLPRATPGHAPHGGRPGAVVAAGVGAGVGGRGSQARSSILAPVSTSDKGFPNGGGGARVDAALALWRHRNKQGRAPHTPGPQPTPAAAATSEVVAHPTSVPVSGVDVTEAGATAAAAAAAVDEPAAAAVAVAAAEAAADAAGAAGAPAPARMPMQAAAVAWAEAGRQSVGAPAVRTGVAARAAGRYSPRAQMQGPVTMYDITRTPGGSDALLRSAILEEASIPHSVSQPLTTPAPLYATAVARLLHWRAAGGCSDAGGEPRDQEPPFETRPPGATATPAWPRTATAQLPPVRDPAPGGVLNRQLALQTPSQADQQPAPQPPAPSGPEPVPRQSPLPSDRLSAVHRGGPSTLVQPGGQTLLLPLGPPTVGRPGQTSAAPVSAPQQEDDTASAWPTAPEHSLGLGPGLGGHRWASTTHTPPSHPLVASSRNASPPPPSTAAAAAGAPPASGNCSGSPNFHQSARDVGD